MPATLDWDLWLGPAPQRPYNPAYLPFVWRGWWDFGTGALGDIGCHAMDPVFRALKLGAPLSVQGASTRVNEETFPLGSMVTWEFPARSAEPQAINRFTASLTGAAAGGIEMPACKLVWYDGGLRPPRPDGLPDGAQMGDNGRLLVGDKGFILGNKAFPAERAEAAAKIQSTIPRSAGHYEEWIAACKGGAPAGSNFDWAGPLAESVLLGNVALRVQLREDLTLCKLLWDGPGLKFTNLADANHFVRRDYRAGPVDVSWEPDLFGRIRNTVRESQYAAQVSAADLENERLSEQSVRGRYYFELRGQDALQELYKRTIAADRKSLELTRALVETGIDSPEDVAQAEVTLRARKRQQSALRPTGPCTNMPSQPSLVNPLRIFPCRSKCWPPRFPRSPSASLRNCFNGVRISPRRSAPWRKRMRS